MEGLIFFVAIIVFVFRTVNKLKKAASGNKKTAAPKTSPLNEHPFKDKLDDLVRSLEEAEKLKKEGHGSESFRRTDFPSDDEQYEAEYFSERNNKNVKQPDFEYSSFADEADSGFSGTVFSGSGSVKYDLKDKDTGRYSHKDYTGENSGGTGDIKKDSIKTQNEETVRKSIKSEGSILRGLNKSSSSGKKQKSILSALSKYPEMQKAVVLKEILDTPVSSKF